MANFALLSDLIFSLLCGTSVVKKATARTGTKWHHNGWYAATSSHAIYAGSSDLREI